MYLQWILVPSHFTVAFRWTFIQFFFFFADTQDTSGSLSPAIGGIKLNFVYTVFPFDSGLIFFFLSCRSVRLFIIPTTTNWRYRTKLCNLNPFSLIMAYFITGTSSSSLSLPPATGGVEHQQGKDYHYTFPKPDKNIIVVKTLDQLHLQKKYYSLFTARDLLLHLQ